MNLKHHMLLDNPEEFDQQLQQLVQDELDKGSIKAYGQGNLYTYFQTQGHIVSVILPCM